VQKKNEKKKHFGYDGKVTRGQNTYVTGAGLVGALRHEAHEALLGVLSPRCVALARVDDQHRRVVHPVRGTLTTKRHATVPEPRLIRLMLAKVLVGKVVIFFF
jgi:hypothetical protein